MRYMKKNIGFIAAVIILLFLAACGGGEKSNPGDTPVSISISPKTMLIEAGTPVTLKVTVQNTDFTVSSPAAPGSAGILPA